MTSFGSSDLKNTAGPIPSAPCPSGARRIPRIDTSRGGAGPAGRWSRIATSYPRRPRKGSRDPRVVTALFAVETAPKPRKKTVGGHVWQRHRLEEGKYHNPRVGGLPIFKMPIPCAKPPGLPRSDASPVSADAESARKSLGWSASGAEVPKVDPTPDDAAFSQSNSPPC